MKFNSGYIREMRVENNAGTPTYLVDEPPDFGDDTCPDPYTPPISLLGS
ncbi:MAG: hypothetical protein ACNA8H_08020 [Anaerolineales bacterium]